MYYIWIHRVDVSYILTRCLLEVEMGLSLYLSEVKKWSEVAQSCPTLCNPMDCSLPGSSVHGIFQARILEWVAISFSSGSSWPRDQTWVSCVPCNGRQILCQLLHLGISEKAMAPHCSTLAWKIPWTEEPGRLQSMGSQRVGHDWATSLQDVFK